MVQLKFAQQRAKDTGESGFNSCMVQLKLHPWPMDVARMNVLIPVWCN